VVPAVKSGLRPVGLHLPRAAFRAVTRVRASRLHLDQPDVESHRPRSLWTGALTLPASRQTSVFLRPEGPHHPQRSLRLGGDVRDSSSRSLGTALYVAMSLDGATHRVTVAGCLQPVLHTSTSHEGLVSSRPLGSRRSCAPRRLRRRLESPPEGGARQDHGLTGVNLP
jgi:hypothetical protein